MDVFLEYSNIVVLNVEDCQFSKSTQNHNVLIISIPIIIGHAHLSLVRSYTRISRSLHIILFATIVPIYK